jgi:hypothetical protein
VYILVVLATFTTLATSMQHLRRLHLVRRCLLLSLAALHSRRRLQQWRRSRQLVHVPQFNVMQWQRLFNAGDVVCILGDTHCSTDDVSYIAGDVQGPISLLPDTCAGRVTRGVQVRSREERTRSSALEAAVAAEVGMPRRENFEGRGRVTRGSRLGHARG